MKDILLSLISILYISNFFRWSLTTPRGIANNSLTKSSTATATTRQTFIQRRVYRAILCRALELPAIGDPSRTFVSPDITSLRIVGRWRLAEFIGRIRDVCVTTFRGLTCYDGPFTDWLTLTLLRSPASCWPNPSLSIASWSWFDLRQGGNIFDCCTTHEI